MIIMRELNDPRLSGMPSITRVKVSPDLSIADVYLTIMGTPGQQTAALNAGGQRSSHVNQHRSGTPAPIQLRTLDYSKTRRQRGSRSAPIGTLCRLPFARVSIL